MEDKLTLGEGFKVSMSDLAKRVGLLHTVDWPEPSLESKTQRESRSIRGLSASTHRSGFLHLLMFTVNDNLSMQWSAEAIRGSMADFCGVFVSETSWYAVSD